MNDVWIFVIFDTQNTRLKGRSQVHTNKKFLHSNLRIRFYVHQKNTCTILLLRKSCNVLNSSIFDILDRICLSKLSFDIANNNALKNSININIEIIKYFKFTTNKCFIPPFVSVYNLFGVESSFSEGVLSLVSVLKLSNTMGK